jgi:hypothetical protein
MHAFKTLTAGHGFHFYRVPLAPPASSVGTRLTIRSRDDIPNDRLANCLESSGFHDINIIATARYHPKFVAKTQLARWIPSVSLSCDISVLYRLTVTIRQAPLVKLRAFIAPDACGDFEGTRARMVR